MCNEIGLSLSRAYSLIGRSAIRSVCTLQFPVGMGVPSIVIRWLFFRVHGAFPPSHHNKIYQKNCLNSWKSHISKAVVLIRFTHYIQSNLACKLCLLKVCPLFKFGCTRWTSEFKPFFEPNIPNKNWTQILTINLWPADHGKDGEDTTSSPRDQSGQMPSLEVRAIAASFLCFFRSPLLQ